MKASMYFNYTSRSLFRGGQRTILAVFCVAVGVMAIVALQLVGQMINNAFTGNVRDANGGDHRRKMRRVARTQRFEHQIVDDQADQTAHDHRLGLASTFDRSSNTHRRPGAH